MPLPRRLTPCGCCQCLGVPQSVRSSSLDQQSTLITRTCLLQSEEAGKKLHSFTVQMDAIPSLTMLVLEGALTHVAVLVDLVQSEIGQPQ